MNPQYIKVFLKVVELKSLSGAANALYVPQSTVSFQLTQLEKELNAQLLVRERGRRSVELTNAGRLFLPIAQQWQEAERRTEAFIQSNQSYGLRIAASVNGYESLLFNIIEKLTVKMPDLKIKMIIAEWDNVTNSITDNEADIAFSFGRAPREDDGLNQTLVLREDRCILCSANAAFEPNTIPASRLNPAFEIAVRSRNSDNKLPAVRWVQSNIPGNTLPMLSVEKFILAAHNIKGPENWSIFPRSVANKLINQSPEIYSLRDVIPRLPYRDFYLIEPKSGVRSIGVNALLDCICEHVAETSFLHLPEEQQ